MTGVCVSLLASQTEDLLRDLRAAEDVADICEIRGDHDPTLDLERIRGAFAKPLIYTCRAASEGGALADGDPRRRTLLARASAAGFDYIDVEYASGFDDLIAARAGRGLIVSHHDLQGTPDDLDVRHRQMCETGADVVKIVTTPRTVADVGRLLDFANRASGAGRRPLIALAMGSFGQATRVLAARTQAPFTYASLRPGVEAAPGQIPAGELRRTYRVGRITPDTRVFGVGGGDVTRSLSPAIHNAAFEEMGVDAVYVPLSADDLGGFMELARSANLAGFSVTRPFKRGILSFLTSVEPSAEHNGSVNTVTKTKDGWVGSSTDGLGVHRPLARRIRLAGAAIAIVGAGGAARAAAAALREAGARVTLSARDDSSAAATAAALRVESTPWSERARRSYDVLINATPLGSHEAPDETPVPAERLRPAALVFEMVNAPLPTRLLREASAAGCRTIDGIEMLVAQAAAQFETWTGLSAPLTAMDRAARRATVEAP